MSDILPCESCCLGEEAIALCKVHNSSILPQAKYIHTCMRAACELECSPWSPVQVGMFRRWSVLFMLQIRVLKNIWNRLDLHINQKKGKIPGSNFCFNKWL